MSKFKRSRNSEKRIIEINLWSLISVILIVLMGVFCFFTAFGIAKRFLKVTKFEVSYGSRYEAIELASIANIKRGDRLYALSTEEIEEKILSKCAYVESVKVKQSFPNKIKFLTKERSPVWYVEISGDYYVLDKELRVLEETRNKQKLIDEGISYLTLPKIKTAILGEFLTYGDSDEEIEKTKYIMDSLLASPLSDTLSVVDIDNRYDIHLEINGVYSASIGGYSKLDVKIEYLIKAIQRVLADGAVGANIDISDSAQKVSVQPIYNETETEIGKDEQIGVGVG